MALAYFSVCLRRSLVTRASREVSACVGDRLTAAYRCLRLCFYVLVCTCMYSYVFLHSRLAKLRVFFMY